MKGVGIDGNTELFGKPWFACFLTFVAMSLALIPDGIQRWRRRQQSGSSSLMKPLVQEQDAEPARSDKPSELRKVLLSIIPAAFDLLATGLCDMGFLYIPASVWQLLRGAELIFTALFSVFVLKQRSYLYKWLAVAVVVLGIIAVGLASVWGVDAKGTTKGGSAGMLIVGMCLALSGQVVQAAQAVAEEWLVKDIDLPAMTTVGLEGVWGAVLMMLIAFPIVNLLPGSDHGQLEDDMDAIALLGSSRPLFSMVMLFTFSCMTYNMAGIAVTEALSAVHRVMLEALRTGIIWIFGLSVHYFVDENSLFGEVWTPYSWLEALGFVLLMLGQGIYNKMVPLPGLVYPLDEEEMDDKHYIVSPG
eukprot:CAMPEP_0178377360 /NCGR_PEP_ID=MMETSP0689_2-20121128/3878_1 /TAXON_ID=160604 /ORGANISM="Amphidinium massartii, Strain CS-259" /LENGTH=359 /DNA_ID=CAMNT_0019997411 /DNA_START=119 /DNA_END=1195 /DNA_ORIENTATION=+